MEVRLLGPLEAWTNGDQLRLGGPKQRIVLAALALRLGQVVPVEELLEAGWGDALPANPANALQHQVAQLRKVIEPDPATPRHLLTVGAGYTLDASTVTSDVDAVEQGLAEARQALADGDGLLAMTLVEAVLARWRGPALPEFRYDDFASGAAERLDATRLAAVELQVELAMAAGDHESLLPRLAELTTDHPLVESLWVKRAEALHRSGRQPEAIRVIEEARRALIDVGLDLGPTLRALQQAILDDEHRPANDPVSASPPQPVDLPEPPNRLIGRDRDLARVGDLLDRNRVVTLLGPGGAGKTRLAVGAAKARVDRHRRGVWFVALDRLDDPSLVIAEVGRVTAVRENPERPALDTLVDHLNGDALLVLDNAEHVVETVALLVDQLVARCPDLTVLTTSQVVLAAPGETIFEVSPLAVPGRTASIYDPITEVDAVALFVERARQAGAPVERWGDQAMAAAANIVSALDGLPLAIELAAARSRSMSLEDIARGLDDRFALLTGGPRTAPDRQRSLAEAVAWSLGLLGRQDRRFLAELAVLVGPFDVADAAAVTGRPTSEARDVLATLVDRSMVCRAEDVAGSARYLLLESLRQHGTNELGPDALAPLRATHLAHMVDLVGRADQGIRGHDQLVWMERLDAAAGDIRAALAWSLDGGSIELGVRLTADLGRYWDWRGVLAEGALWAARLIDRIAGPVPGLASLLAWRAYRAWEIGQLDEAVADNDRAMAAADALDDAAERASVLMISVLIARTRGAVGEAEARAADLLAAADATGDPWLVAWTNSALATVAVADERLEDAADLASSAITGFAEIGDRRGEAWGQLAMAEVLIERGELAAADIEARAALTGASRLADDRSVLWALEMLAELAQRTGRPADAVRTWGAARPLREARGLPGSVLEIGRQRGLESRLRAAVGDRFDELVERGATERTTIIDRAKAAG